MKAYQPEVVQSGFLWWKKFYIGVYQNGQGAGGVAGPGHYRRLTEDFDSEDEARVVLQRIMKGQSLEKPARHPDCAACKHNFPIHLDKDGYPGHIDFFATPEAGAYYNCPVDHWFDDEDESQ